MIHALAALAGLALATSAPARATENVQAPTAPLTDAAAKIEAAGKIEAGTDKSEAGTGKSEAATRVAEWIAASRDNGALPYAIIDKNAAALFLFDAKGKALGDTPVLIGIAVGDEATPGIGSKNLAEIGPAERTTPAGRFLAKYGMAAGRQSVLWVDYGTSVALHPVPNGNKKERRAARLRSPAAEDNRITFGCINVPLAFYGKKVRTVFRKKGGVVYVLPDTKPLEAVFPRLHVQPFLNGGAL